MAQSAMLKEERHQQILNILYASGKVNVEELTRVFGCSHDTIRRDLSELEEQGILKRVYGGAVPWKRPAPGIDARKNVEKDEKYLVARKAVELVHPGELIAIDGGTTNTLFVSLLPVSIRLRVVTNSFPVAEELRKRPNADVTFLGGHYNKGSQTTVGELVLSQLKDYHFDQCFLGAYAVDDKRGVSVPYPYEDEAPVKKYLAENCRELNVLCDNSKLDKEANYIVCPLERITHLVCSRRVSEEMKKRYLNKII